jgi:hypothetical protein
MGIIKKSASILITILLRILSLPFASGILLVAFTYKWIKGTVLFLIYGGEFIRYDKAINRKTIFDVYNELTKDK